MIGVRQVRHVWLATALTVALCAPAARAASQTFVSSAGSDGNACTYSAPCATFQSAYNVTDAGGRIDALTAGNFGPVFVAKSMTIDGHGLASIVQTYQAVVVDPPGSGTAVVIRGITIEGCQIPIAVGGQVHAVIDHVRIDPGSASVGITVMIDGPSVDIRDTVIEGSGTGVSGGMTGILANAAATMTLNNVEIHNTYQAIGMGGDSLFSQMFVTARNSDFSGNAYGVGAGSFSDATLENCVISHTTSAVVAAGPSIVRLSNTTITDNTTALATSAGGSIVSFVNNRFHGNATQGPITTSVYQK